VPWRLLMRPRQHPDDIIDVRYEADGEMRL
jgi:hypothetical protein